MNERKIHHILWQSDPQDKELSPTSPKFLEVQNFKEHHEEDSTLNYVDVIYMGNVSRKAIIHTAR
jgi:hypothetical protein